MSEHQQYSIPIYHSCGHIETHRSGHEIPIESDEYNYLADKTCTSCRVQVIKIEEESRGFAHLEGTEKQIAWANDIRGNMLHRLNEYRNKLESIVPAFGAVAEHGRAVSLQEQLCDDALAALGVLTDSSWFIENRRCDEPELVRLLTSDF